MTWEELCEKAKDVVNEVGGLKMKSWHEYTKKELLKLPTRKWDNVTKYYSVLLVNTRVKHPSGYNLFAVIGCDGDGVPVEKCGLMDDFRFGDIYENSQPIRDCDIAIDCSMNGVFRIHARRFIYVGPSTSTTMWWIGEKYDRRNQRKPNR